MSKFDLIQMNRYNFSELLTTWSTIRKNAFLSKQHLEYSSFLSKVFVQFEQFVPLREFVSGLTCEEFALLRGNEYFLKALVQLEFYEGNFKEAIMTIKNGTFREPSELFDIWNMCHYRLIENETGKQMTAHGRFKIRKRFPPPSSICPDGVTKRFQRRPPQQPFKWIQNHSHGRYPDTQELDHLTRAIIKKDETINVRKSLQKLRKNLKKKQQRDAGNKCVDGKNIKKEADKDSFTAKTNGCGTTNEPCVQIDLSTRLSEKTASNALWQCNSPSAESCQPHEFDNNILMSGEDIKPDLSVASIDANFIINAYKNLSSSDDIGIENQVSQEKVTLHYFSSDVRNSWHPSRIQFLYDICRQEMLNKRDAASSEIEHTDTYTRSQFDVPFPPNISVIPFKRTDIICNFFPLSS